MARIPVAVQLDSVGADAKADLAGTLGALAEMGYEGVEFAGYYGYSAEELKGLLDQVGLKAVGSHVGEDVLRPENLAETIAFHKTLGDKFITVAWHDPSEDPEEWKAFARRLTEAAAALAPHGMYTGYHTHGHDAHPLAGSTVWDLVAQNSSEAVVMQLDLGNAAAGGGDAMAMLKKYLSRARTVHLKDYSAANKNQPLLGDGDLPWAEVLELCEGSGVTEWLIVEQEFEEVDAMEGVRKGREYLRSLGR
jgi:sugar phosphate isomerase/epimerase